MTIHIALLRGINVGGHNKINMADLRQMFENMGFGQVQTYIQSGNVLFQSNEREETLRDLIQEELTKTFGISISVVLRTKAEILQILAACPFTSEEISVAEASGEGESLYVSMLVEAPVPGEIDRLLTYQNEGEAFRVNGRDVYLLFHASIRDSKLAANLSKISVLSTVRNWKTLNKLASLATAMEE